MMPPRDYDDRRVEVYFGPSRKVETTKEELAEFIIDEMGLERSDGGPKWTEGVAELVKLGMTKYEERFREEPGFSEEVQKLNEKLDEYQSEIRRLANTKQEPYDTLIEASNLSRRAQARILKVLSHRVSDDDWRMEYVDLFEVADETDFDFSIVAHHVHLLELGGWVDTDQYRQEVKLVSRNGLEEYCDEKLLDIDNIT